MKLRTKRKELLNMKYVITNIGIGILAALIGALGVNYLFKNYDRAIEKKVIESDVKIDSVCKRFEYNGHLFLRFSEKYKVSGERFSITHDPDCNCFATNCRQGRVESKLFKAN